MILFLCYLHVLFVNALFDSSFSIQLFEKLRKGYSSSSFANGKICLLIGFLIKCNYQYEKFILEAIGFELSIVKLLYSLTG
jgi:hypothetical protein